MLGGEYWLRVGKIGQQWSESLKPGMMQNNGYNIQRSSAIAWDQGGWELSTNHSFITNHQPSQWSKTPSRAPGADPGCDLLTSVPPSTSTAPRWEHPPHDARVPKGEPLPGLYGAHQALLGSGLETTGWGADVQCFGVKTDGVVVPYSA